MAEYNVPSQPISQSQGELSTCGSYITESQNLLDVSMPPLDKKQQTRLWQQNQYLADSGIQSAIGTHTPSVNSKLGIEEMDHDESLNGQTSGMTLPPWSSRGRSSGFPSDSCFLSPATPGASSLIGMDLGSDAASLTGSRTSVNLDSRGNKLPDIDTDEAASAIPDLVKLIKDEDDQVVIYQASMMVFQLSKSEAIDALIQSTEMIDCIISALGRTDDPETVRFLAGTLYNMSQTQPGLKEIFAAHCIPCLVALLNSPVESVLFYAITTLHNLLLHQEGAKAVVRESGCLQKMTTLLQKNNIKFLTICTDCLQILAYGHQDSKLVILSSGGPSELVRILRTYQYEKLLWTTARVLKVLSVCTSNKPVIIEAGGMDALTKHLHHSSQRLVLNCLWTLRNLSDAATKLDSLQHLLQSLVQLLGSGDTNIVTCAAGILSNLTCNNCDNKLTVYKIGGLRGLMYAIGNSSAKEDILEPCMCAMRHLTSRHEDEERARRDVVSQLNGLPVIAHVLHAATAGICPDLGLVCQPPQNPLTSWTLVKAIVGLLRNLSMNIDNHCPMRECGLVTGLCLLLYGTQHEILKHNASRGTGVGPQFQTVIQNVRLEEIVEGLCGAIHMLAREPGTRVHLSRFHAPNLNASTLAAGGPGLSIFIHFLYSPHETIQRASAGVLVEVSQDRDGLEVLANFPGACARLEELVHSRNEAISTYASAIVIRLTEERKESTSPTILPPHLDALNTPPHSMDVMTPVPINYGSQHMNSQPYSAGSHHYPHYVTSPHQMSVPSPNPSMSMDLPNIAVSPPPGSLSAMLGPPPSCPFPPAQQPQHHSYYYSQSNADGSCPPCWSGFPMAGACSDPACVYGNCHYDPGYGPPPSGFPPGHPPRQAAAYKPLNTPYLHHITGSPRVPPDYSDQHMTQPPSAKGTPCYSMDTSGYASPINEKIGYPGNTQRMPDQQAMLSPMHSGATQLVPRQSAKYLQPLETRSGLSAAHHSSDAASSGYLSPELLSRDHGESAWLSGQGLM